MEMFGCSNRNQHCPRIVYRIRSAAVRSRNNGKNSKDEFPSFKITPGMIITSKKIVRQHALRRTAGYLFTERIAEAPISEIKS